MVSGSEVAFFSINSTQLNDIENENSNSSKQLLALRKYPRRLLATILIANNLINIAIVLISAPLISQLLPENTLGNWGNQLHGTGIFEWTTPASISGAINFLITVVGVTFILVLFGEVAPKIYAKINNVGLAKTMSFPLTLMFRVFSPFSSLLVGWSDRIEKKLQQNNLQSNANKEDIDLAIDLTVSGKTASSQEASILKGIIKFNDVAVKQIMCSRVDVVSVSKEISYGDLLKVIQDSGYSRIPVYEEDFDNVLGILYVKDLLGFLNEDEDFNWTEQIRTNVLYVPESKKINELLKEFQTERMHMAVVVDEYGGSSGIVTLEDVMEEVIGEIKDEFDDEQELEYRKINEHTFIFEGKTLLNDVCRVIGEDTTLFDDVKGDADSIAGLLLEISGRLPKKGLTIPIGNIKFTVIAVTKRRITKIKLERTPE